MENRVYCLYRVSTDKQVDGVSGHKVRAENRDKLQIIKDGGFKGGVAPYGYDLVKSGRLNEKKHELYELALNETEAAVVRIIFEKYVREGYGAKRIAAYLSNQGYRARTGKKWHHGFETDDSIEYIVTYEVTR